MTTCGECGREVRIGDWPWCPHEDTLRRDAQPFDPVLIFKDAQGNVRFPGRNDAPTPEGFRRVELRTVREVRAFEREMNLKETARHDAAQGREDGFHSYLQGRNRAELRALMDRMSPAGREFAAVAMEESDRRQGQRPAFDPGFRIDVFSDNASNRELHRDERTGWKPRKD